MAVSATHNQRGALIVEVVIGISIVLMVLAGVVQTLSIVVQSASDIQERNRTLLLAEEGIEFLFYLRSVDWTNISGLTTNTSYSFSVSTTSVATVSSPEVIDGVYTRTFTIWPVYRDSDDDIVASTTGGAVLDPGAFYAEVFVTSPSATSSLWTIISNIHNE